MCRYVIIAGVNGAGKTTLYQSNLKIRRMERINVDEIVRSFGKWDHTGDVVKAGRIAVAEIKDFLPGKYRLIRRRLFCGSSILKNMVTAKKQLKKVLEYCDKVELFDNSTAFERVAIYENHKWNLLKNDIPIWCRDIVG